MAKIYVKVENAFERAMKKVSLELSKLFLKISIKLAKIICSMLKVIAINTALNLKDSL